MSKSYAKTLLFSDKATYGKKQANKKVRRTANIGNGDVYKKVYEQWNIRDYKSKITKQDELEGLNMSPHCRGKRLKSDAIKKFHRKDSIKRTIEFDEEDTI